MTNFDLDDLMRSWVSIAASINFTILRRRLCQADLQVIGSIDQQIPIPWSGVSAASCVTKAGFAILLAWAGAGFTLGVSNIITRAEFFLIASSSLWFVLAWFYCRQPYRITLGTTGISWKGKSYSWDKVQLRSETGAVQLRFLVQRGTKPDAERRLVAIDTSGISCAQRQVIYDRMHRCAS